MKRDEHESRNKKAPRHTFVPTSTCACPVYIRAVSATDAASPGSGISQLVPLMNERHKKLMRSLDRENELDAEGVGCVSVFGFSSVVASLEAEEEEDPGLSFHPSDDGSLYHHASNLSFGGGGTGMRRRERLECGDGGVAEDGARFGLYLRAARTPQHKYEGKQRRQEYNEMIGK